jgi:hypothetical protein
MLLEEGERVDASAAIVLRRPPRSERKDAAILEPRQPASTRNIGMTRSGMTPLEMRWPRVTDDAVLSAEISHLPVDDTVKVRSGGNQENFCGHWTGASRDHFGGARARLERERARLGRERAHAGLTRAHLRVARAHVGLARAHLRVARAHVGLARGHFRVARAHVGLARAHLRVARAHIELARAHLRVTRAHCGVRRASSAGDPRLSRRRNARSLGHIVLWNHRNELAWHWIAPFDRRRAHFRHRKGLAGRREGLSRLRSELSRLQREHPRA